MIVYKLSVAKDGGIFTLPRSDLGAQTNHRASKFPSSGLIGVMISKNGDTHLKSAQQRRSYVAFKLHSSANDKRTIAEVAAYTPDNERCLGSDRV
ncbi:hypothetical protein N7507_009024 [Penicillium longicatenatum]|nr:hypothetical protein N7507_009024 [Penicillium longicatenatum]